jgi:hypothetical protein
MSKTNLMAFAKGETAKAQSVLIFLARNTDGTPEIVSSKLLEPQFTKDVIVRESEKQADVEFWKTFDTTALVEAEKEKLINNLNI